MMDEKRFEEIMEGIGRKIEGLQRSFDIQQKVVSDMAGSINDIRSSVTSISNDVRGLANRVATIESTQEKVTDDLSNVRADVTRNESEINSIQQALLANDFVIYGLPPEVNNSHIKEILTNIGTQLNEEISSSMLKSCFARHNKNKTSTLIVGSFLESGRKERILRRLKERRNPINCDDILTLAGASKWRGKQISIKNQLTKYSQNLLSLARERNQGRFEFIWESEGRILMKKNNTSKPIQITSIDQLANIFNQHK
ncbi:CLUMA_CG016220, isoform A [Clunio marinus]|uniref:CLUMA_CG016220, isoform A n=1 Tax=Clunio marinus TaxID=568069 RepID=A0A1J1IVA7_9DIPT|nr:CLUMA_CG016220, isoform A [Clunio marinus]